MERIAAVLDFWFDPESEPLWFKKDAAFDAAIRERFVGDYERAAAGALDAWKDTADGALALVIALDQFPRNLFRGSARAFATDAKAVAVAGRAIDRGFDRRLEVVRRKFLYLPFTHSESLADQRRGVTLFEAAGTDSKTLKFARRHLEIVARFGRFPHRNQDLGRETTADEAAFLAGPDSSF